MQFVRHGRSLVMRRKRRRMRREGGMKDVDGQLETEWNEKFQRRRETNKNLNRNEQLNDITKSFSILLLKLLSPSRFCRRCLWKEMNQRHEIFHNFSFSLSCLEVAATGLPVIQKSQTNSPNFLRFATSSPSRWYIAFIFFCFIAVVLREFWPNDQLKKLPVRKKRRVSIHLLTSLFVLQGMKEK